MTRRSASAVAAAAALAAAALAAALAVRRRRRAAGTLEPPPARREWRCACGQEYLVAGTDRHRVYWLAGAGEDDPVLEQRCPRCERALPAEHEAAA